MFIRNGRLYRTGSALTFFGLVPPDLEFQLRDEAGKAVHGDYTGKGDDYGNRVTIGDASNPEAHIHEYQVDPEPTPESDALFEGWFLAMTQARRTQPRDERLLEGWRQGCRAIDGLSEAQRKTRRRVIKNAGSRAPREVFVREMLYTY